MALRNILGQDRALNILRGCVSKDRIAHAYLFAGEDGIGKRLTAVNFAKTLNCQQNTERRTQNTEHRHETNNNLGSGIWALGSDVDCCDECPSCIKINKLLNPETLITPEEEKEPDQKIFMSHPDVVLIQPYKGEIRIKIIRKLEEFLSYKAYEGKWKVVIIDGADSMNKTASNAILKTLEEPPGQSILLLISALPEMLSLTIRSRCQRIYFSPLPLKDMNRVLESQFPGEDSEILDGKASLVGLLSGGRPGWALSRDLITRRDRTFDDFKTLLDRAEENLWEDRDSMEEWFDWVHLWLRDIAVFKATGREDLMINLDRGNEIRSISQKTSLKDILKLSSSFYDIKNYLRFNLNKQLTLYHTYLSLRKTFG